MGDCRCGCGEPAENGDFIAGHGQKLSASLVKEVGGLFVLQELDESAKQYSYGEKGTNEFLDLIR
jgi:hypothetical protein